MTKIFAMPRHIFLKIHPMNRSSFLYIWAKLKTKIVKSKQDTAKSLAYLYKCSVRLLTGECESAIYKKKSYIYIFLLHILLKIPLNEALSLS